MNIRRCPEMSKDANGSADIVGLRLCLTRLATSCSAKTQLGKRHDVLNVLYGDPALSGTRFFMFFFK